MEWSAAYEALSTREREELCRILNRLISTTFLVKGQEQDRRDFYFVERHLPLIQGYLSVLGWELIIDRAQGVCQLTGRQGSQRLGLSAMESVLLLILRLLYEEQRKRIALIQDVVVLTQDVQAKYLALKIRRRPLEKKLLRESFIRFRRHHLVELLDGDVTDPDCRIKILPSILFAVRVDSLQALHARLEGYRKEGTAEPQTVEEATEQGDGEEAAGI